MLKNNIQHRIILGTAPELPKNFDMNGQTYKVLGLSSRRHLIPDRVPIGVAFTGFTGQFILEDNKKNRYETYIYFYKKMEGEWCAVVETMEEII